MDILFPFISGLSGRDFVHFPILMKEIFDGDYTGFPNNSLLEGFFKKQGFKKGKLAQYEMYLPI